jgi:AraC family transcriptional regulator
MSEKGEKQTASNGIVKMNTLAELGREFEPVVSSAELGWSGFQLERYFVPSDVLLVEKFYTSHIIGVTLGGKYTNSLSAIGGRRDVPYLQGESLIYPAEFPHTGRDPQEMDLLLIYLEQGFVKQAAQDLVVGDCIEIVPQVKLDDGFVGDISAYLLLEAETNGATGKLYAESLMTALAAKLINNYSTARVLPHKHKGGLAKHKLRLTVEFINEHLSEDLSLNALATLCGLSQFHFAKAFKQSTGMSPHTFIIARRIERAKLLLRETNLTVSEIAFRLGFADQSHFTKIFRKHTGVTPTGFQIQIR